MDEGAFSPDGHTLITGGFGNKAILWDITNRAHPRQLATLSGPEDRAFHTLAFNPDRRTMIAGDSIWDVTDRTHPRELAAISSIDSSGNGFVFGPGGDTFVGGSDNGAGLWDITDRARPVLLASMDIDVRDILNVVAFSSDRRMVVAGSEGGIAVFWDVAQLIDLVSHPADVACGIAGRGLSVGEWTVYASGLPYRRTCTQ
jgi:WD40 repeat protein